MLLVCHDDLEEELLIRVRLDLLHSLNGFHFSFFLYHKDFIENRQLFLEKGDQSSAECLAEILLLPTAPPVLAVLRFVDQDIEFV